MSSQLNNSPLPDTPKPKRSPPPPPPPPRISGTNSPLMRCTSPALSQNSHQHLSSCCRSTTGSTTSSYASCRSCHFCSSSSTHRGFIATSIHNKPSNSSNNCHNCNNCNQITYRKPIEIQHSNHSNCCSSGLGHSNMSHSSMSHSSLHSNQHHHHNNNIYAPKSSSSSDNNNFAHMLLHSSNGSNNSANNHKLMHHQTHNQTYLMNQPQDFFETSSVTSTSSAGCHHNMIQNVCPRQLMYPTNTSTRMKAHRPVPPTPDQKPHIPDVPSRHPLSQSPCTTYPDQLHSSTSVRQAKPPVPSVRSLPKSSHMINQQNQPDCSDRLAHHIQHSEKSIEGLSIEIASLDIFNNSDITMKPQLSPLPKLKFETFNFGSKAYEHCSERAYMLFMEHHYETTSKYLHGRMQTRLRVENEYKIWKELLSPHTSIEDVRKLFYKKESNHLRLKRQKMTKDDFEQGRLLGRGVIGEVHLVKKKSDCAENDDKLYAMKTLDKSEVLKRNGMADVWVERDILVEANSEWIVKMFYSFQDEKKLYFIMEYTPGGDLMTLLERKQVFDENATRFYIAEISLAVQFVHDLGVIHRDIKPENILIDKNGHLKLSDFGQSTGFRWHHDKQYYLNYRESTDESSNEGDKEPFCFERTLTHELGERQNLQQYRRHYSDVGSINYKAPEVLTSEVDLKTPWTKLCDWWSVGVIFYEMILGYCPFRNHQQPYNEQMVRNNILNWTESLIIPTDRNLSRESIDLMRGLLRDVNHRLCQNGIDDMKRHPFFANLDWDNIRTIEPPYKSDIDDSEDNFPANSILPKFIYEGDNARENLTKNQDLQNFFEFTYRCYYPES